MSSNMTAGQWAGAIVGAVAGFFTGGSTWYYTAAAMASGASTGMAIGGAIDPPKGPHLVGPRLNDLSVQTATYGAVIPRVYGTVALLGNVFWLENNQLKENVKNEGGGKGGSSPETTTYSYSATFAVGLCQGPIDGVRRIWVGAKLIYDAGSDDIESIIASNQAAELFTIHTGSDTQLPDDRMQATLGVANTPAYRGLAYIVLKDYPLADHGNSLLGAQVKVEVMTSAVVPDPVISLIGTTAVDHCAANVAIDETVMLSSEMTGSYPNFYRNISIYKSIGQSIVALNGFTPEVNYTQITYMRNGDVSGIVLSVAGGTEHRIYYKDGSFDAFNIGIASGGIHSVAVFDDTIYISYSVSSLYYVTRYPLENSPYSGVLTCTVSSGYHTIGSMTAASSKLFCLSSYVADAASNPPVEVYEIDVATMTQTATHTYAPLTVIAWPAIYAESDTVFYVLSKSSTENRSKIIKYDNGSWSVFVDIPIIFGNSTALSFIVKNKIAIVSNPKISGAIGEVYLINIPIASDYLTLADVVSAECINSGLLTSGDIDVTGLIQAVRGYRVSSVAAIRSAIEPLQGAWPFDVIQAGYKIKFKPRGSAVVATIPAIDLDAREAGKAGGVSITSSREMDSILPCRVVLKHLDVNREYDMGEQYAERLNTAAVNIQTVEMPIVMTAGEAAGNAEMLLYLYWLERYDISFTLPPTYNHLEPGDVITVNATGATYELRLTAITYTSDGRLECAAKYNSAAVYLPTALGEEGQSTGQTLTITGPTAYELLDIPLLLDATDMPGFPVAMSGYMAGWPGGILYRSDDAGQTWSGLQSFTAPGCVIGTAGAPLAVGQTSLIDKAGVLSVTLISGSLSSVSEAAMLNGSNHFAYGAHGRWEIIAAQNCTLQGDGSYVLTDLLRGRFGSEWACGLHVTGDRIVFLDASSLAFVTANINTVGMARTYRGITSGKGISTDRDRAFTYAGVNLECLSPVYLNGNRHPTTNDWSLDWIRRTRVGGEWRDYVDATLGEAAQSYEVEIYSSAAYTTLKRTISSLTTPAASYTSANQVTDFGSNQATLYVKAYQLSANVGRGYPLTTSITR